MPSSTVLDGLDGAIGAMAEPMVSHDCIAFYLLSRAVSEHLTVVQSGQGADELLAGYDWYPRWPTSRRTGRWRSTPDGSSTGTRPRWPRSCSRSGRFPTTPRGTSSPRI